MARNMLASLVGAAIMLVGPQCAGAQEPAGAATEPFVYTEGFEAGTDPVQFWTSYEKKYTVNFKGVTTEKARSGAQSFKLDVTFDEASRFLWHIPVEPPVPVGGEFAFSGHMLIGEGTTATAALGLSFQFRPTRRSGCTAPGAFHGSTMGKWQAVDSDVVARGRQTGDVVMRMFEAGIEGDNVGAFLEGIILDLRGEAGQRVVLYVDDLELRGDVPTEAAYREEMASRWAPVTERFRAMIAGWETALGQADEALAAYRGLSPGAEAMRREMEGNAREARGKVAAAKDAGSVEKQTQHEIARLVKQLGNLSSIRAVSDAETAGRSAVIYAVSPMTSEMILPADRYVSGQAASELSLTAARGEYEPASFVVSALLPLDSVTVAVSDLRAGARTIPAESVDVKAIKCWHQGGTAGVRIHQDKSTRLLIPELLLNDDTLIRVDEENQEDYAKLSFPDGPTYAWIGDPTNLDRGGSLGVDAFPIKDSPRLLPVTIAAGRNKQFWLTVHVPADAPAGTYEGTVTVRAGDAILAELALGVEVLPFELLEPYYTSSMDYHGRPGPGKGTISSWGKSWEQFRRELENMVAHGLRNCQHYSIKPEILGEVLKVREEVGMDNRTLYLKGTIPIGNATEPEALEQIKRDVRAVLELTRPHGTETVHFYGIDEKTGEELRAQRPAWEAVREAGGKIFVAGGGDNIEMMGDIQDMHVRAGWPDAEEVARWHAYGHKIFSYANPQTGVEDPVLYRRNFGLLLWKYEYDGAATNAYQHTFGTTWNDFDHKTYRAHTIAYPTVDGVVDTIAWEGYREGVDDVRYVTTLQESIARAAESNDPVIGRRAGAAREFLEGLKAGTRIESGDLDAIRREIVAHAKALSAMTEP